MSEARGEAREWRAGDAPPLGLLRLREADIVRLCGLSAASWGLDLAARRALSQPRRDGPRLSALVGVDEPVEAWIEAVETPEPVERLTLALTRWGCAAHSAGAPAPPGAPGCEHIAAILSAWVRAPGDFRSPVAPQDERSTPPTPSPPPISAAVPDEPRAPAKAVRAGPRAPASLADELLRLPERELPALARRILGSDGAGATSARAAEETLAALEAALRDPEALARLLARLEPEARELLAWLRLAGGALTVAGLETLAARSGRPISALRGLLATLERHGLLFPNLLPDAAPAPSPRHEARDRSWLGVTGWRIAPETRAALPRELPIQPVSRAELAAARPRVEKGEPRGLLLALALLPRAPAPLGSPPPRDPDGERGQRADTARAARGERAGGALTPEDLPESALLAAARAAGINPDTARLARRVTLWARDWDGSPGAASVAESAPAPPSERLRAYQAAFAVWRAARSPADLMDLERATGSVRMRYDHTHEAFRPAALADEAAAARGWVTRLLGLATPGAWYRVDDLVQLIWYVNPYFLRGKQLAWRAPVWQLERVADGRPLRPNIREEWAAAEGAYLRALLVGPLSLWGALDLALDSARAPRLFRLTPLGRALLARPPRDGAPGAADGAERAAAQALVFDWGPVATLTKEGALAVQPLAATPALLGALDQWAEVTGLAGGRLLYTFTAARALARFDEGLSLERALAPLRAAGLVRAAQTLAPRLEGWRQGYGDARLTGGLAVVEGRDEATLREALAAAPGIAARARRLGPAVVALSHADAETLRAALARKGWEL